jgi:uncharacterized protein (UPF0261 family)
MPVDPRKTILLIATLDTKEEETTYLRQALERCGMNVLVLDTGMRGDVDVLRADIRRDQVARAGGSSYALVQEMPRLQAEAIMADGVATLVNELYTQGRFDAVMGIGGFDGTLLATAGMRSLPFGVPKLMVSAMACGEIPFGDYVGTKDITIVPSVVDLAGTNELICKVLDNAVGALVGMVQVGIKPTVTAKNLVAVSMYGQTTPAAMAGRPLLRAAGLTPVAFHPNGVGGKAMEEFIHQGVFVALWDLTTQELSDQHLTGRPSGGLSRLETAGKCGLPQVVVPGCVDFVWGTPEVMAQRFPNRLTYQYNPRVQLVKLMPEEVVAVAQRMAEKLNQSRGPTALALPLRGVSMFDAPGGPLHQPEVTAALFDTLRAHVDARLVDTLEIDAHINDAGFARICVTTLIDMLRSQHSQTIL